MVVPSIVYMWAMIVLALTLAFLVLCIEDFAYFDYGILKFPTY